MKVDSFQNSATDHQESKTSNLEKWSQFDALGQAVLVYELGGVPPVTEKRRGEKHQSQVRWVMHRHECPLLFYCFAFIKVIVSMWFIWFGSRVFCSPDPSPPCSLSLCPTVWFHPTPLKSFTARWRWRRGRSWPVFVTEKAEQLNTYRCILGQMNFRRSM